MKNSKLNTIIIVIVTAIVLFFALKDDFIEKINYLFSFNILWLIFAIILVVSYWILKSLVIYYCTKKFNNQYKFKQSLKLIMDVQFVNGITPFATGGQPYQVYRLKKQGLNLRQSTNVAIQDFIVYQIALITLGTIAIITNYFLGIFPESSLLKKLVVIGYLINVAVIILLFIVAFNKKGNKLILNTIIKIGAKLKLLKHKEEFLNKVDSIILDFHNSAKILMKSKGHFIKIILLNFTALTLLYLVPFALIKGLHLDINPFIVIITSAYVMLIGSFIPIPGGSGGLEYGFVEFFGVFITGAKLSSIMIAWRIITYYLGVILGAITINSKEEIKCE